MPASAGLVRGWTGGLNFPSPATTGGTLPTVSYNTTILADTPEGFWDYTGTDLTGNGNNAALTASPGTTALPNGDLAMTFNGTTQYATVATSPIFSPAPAANGGNTGIMCVEAWIAPSVTTFPNEENGYVHWAGKGDESTMAEWTCRMYGLDNTDVPYRANRISGYAYNQAGGIGVGAYFQDTVTVNAWIYYFLVLNTTPALPTYPDGYVKIYKGYGTPGPTAVTMRNEQNFDSVSPPISPTYGTEPVMIGTRDLHSFFEGAIGKFAIYSYELTPTQISAHYSAMYSAPVSLYTVVNGSTAAAAGGANTGWSYSTSSGWSFTGTPVLSGLSIGTFGLTISTSGTTVTGCQITGQVVVASAGSISGVTIGNCVITQASGGAGSAIKLGGGSSYVATGTTVSGCTISGTDSATNRLATGIIDTYGNAAGTVISGNNIYWCRTGMNLTTGTVLGNYVHDPGFQGGDQTDCILSPGSNGAASFAAGLAITGNTLLNRLGQTSAVNLASSSSTAQYVTVAGNLLGGGTYTVYGGGASGNNITVTGNRFTQAYSATSGATGPVTLFEYTTGSNTWSGNVIHDTGTAVPSH
jgi:hypothetical protein